MRSLLSGLLVVLAFENATAQLEPWHTTHPDVVDSLRYRFIALDCYGESCTAAGLETNDNMPRFSNKTRILFWRSDDAGATWRVQDPGLGYRKDESTKILDLQMLDSTHVIAVGDSGLFVTSSNAGSTWKVQHLDSTVIHSLHFCDFETGAVVLPRSKHNLAVTSDGGEHWTWHSVYFGQPNWYWPWQVQTIGNGKSRAISYAAGPFYTTTDSWETIDSSRMVFDTSNTTNEIHNFQSLGEDTIIAYGTNTAELLATNHLDMSMVRSEDGGRTWTPVVMDDTVLGRDGQMSRLNAPYVLLAGNNRSPHPRYLGISLDTGKTWSFPEIVFDTTVPFYTQAVKLLVTPSGVAVGIFGNDARSPLPTFLARASLAPQSVQSYERILYNTRVYPNPANVSFNVRSMDREETVAVYDILGHEVLHGKLDGAGHAQFDVSGLPRGVYSVILKHNGIPLPVGKVAVINR